MLKLERPVLRAVVIVFSVFAWLMNIFPRLRPSTPTAVASLALSVAALLAACGGGGGAAAPAPTPTPTGQMPAFTVPVSQAVAVSGRVNLVIANTGGDVTGCSVAANSPAQLPAGLMVEAFTSSGKRTCRVFGDVAASVAPGSYTVAISGASAVGAATVMVTFVVSAAGVAAPALADVAGVRELRLGERASVVFENSGGDATGCAAAPGSTALPGALTFELHTPASGAVSCALVGTPGAEVAQAVTLTVRATNAGGDDDATVMVTVVPEAPALGDIVAVQELTLGAAASVAFPNTGGAVTGCAAAPGSTALPSALTFELHTPASGAASCALVGMPDAEVAQAVTLTVRAANAGGMDDATVMVTVRVAPPDLQNIVNRVPLALDQAQSVPFPNEGGAATGCAAAPGGAALPSGMAFELHTPASGPASCALAGTPDVEAAAAVTLTVRASNSAGDSDATVSVTVLPQAPALGDVTAPVVLTAGVEAEAVTFGNSGGAVQAAGGCALAQGVSLPMGLSLARAEPAGETATCEISGTPDTAAGAVAAATYTIVASNAGGSATATVTIEVVEPATVAPDLADLAGTRALTIGLRIQPLTFVNSGGAVQPVNGCSVTAGDLPMGLSLARAEPAGGTATCEISGAPAGPAAAAAEVTVTGANAAGTDTASVTIAVEAAVVATMAPDLQDATPPALTAGEQASVEVANNGGAVATCRGLRLPGGLMVEPGAPAAGGAATCVITGSPAAPTTAPAAAAVTGTNAAGSDTATITITVNPPAPDIIDIVGVQERAPGGEIAPIAFSNSGGGAAGCAVPAGSPALPPALAVRTATVAGRESCEIHGVPSAPAAAAEYTIEASNDGGADTATVTILVAFPAPVLLDIDAPQRLALGKMVTGISFTSTGGDVAAEGCSLAAVAGQSVPAGLEATDVDGESGKPRTCAITGTPMEVVESAVTLVVTATGEGGATDEATIMVTVLPDPPALVSIPGTRDLTVNVVIAPIRFDNDGGRVEEMGCSLAAEGGAAAPPGLSAEVARGSGSVPDSCQIVGTPTMVAETAVTLTVTATNEGGGMDTATVSVRVLPLAPVLADFEGTQRLTLGEAVSGVVFRNTGGGVEEMGCSLATTGGAPVPLGLRVEVVAGTSGGADTCRLAGIPTVEMATPLELTVTGANGSVSDTATVTITVLPQAPALADKAEARNFVINRSISPLIPFTNTGGDVRVGGCTLAAMGGAQVPRGLRIVHVPAVGGSKATCALGGTPMALTTGAVTLEITGVNNGGSSTATIVASVIPMPTVPVLDSIGLQQLQVNVSLLDPIVFTNTGGGELNPDTASTKGCVVAPDLPEGLMVERTTDGDSCQITGNPAAGTERREYRITATNRLGSGMGSISILVAPDALSLALDTHHQVNYRGVGSWLFSTMQTSDGEDSLASFETTESTQRSCVDIEFRLPGRYSFNWLSLAERGVGLFLFTEENGAARRLAATGSWETETDELKMRPGGGASSREGVLAWCQGSSPSQHGAAFLDQVSYVEAPVGLVASPSSSTSVDLVWDAYPGATHYMVEQGASADGTGAVAVTTGSGQTTNTLSIDSLTAGEALYFWVSACDGNGCTARSLAASATPRVADSDGDGLLDIHSLADLAAMRHSLDGSALRHSGLLEGSNEGCPLAGCGGYELMGSLDFNADGQSDGTWGIGVDGEAHVDPGDMHYGWKRAVNGGWEPIGNCGADKRCDDDTNTFGDEALDNIPFAAVFDGGGHSITGLASVRDDGSIGMFGLIGEGGEVRNLRMSGGLVSRRQFYLTRGADLGGLAGNVVGGSIVDAQVEARVLGIGSARHRAGGLVGMLRGGSIMSSRATGEISNIGHQGVGGGLVGRIFGGQVSGSSASGDVDGGAGIQSVGGLVGYQTNAVLSASFATGDVNGDDGRDSVGGLVGTQHMLGFGTDIVACYASGDVNGDDGSDFVGGLVGQQTTGLVTASYATGDAYGGDGDSDDVGGLVGFTFVGSISSSYATGATDGGEGLLDSAGALVGSLGFATVLSSWGFGAASGGEGGSLSESNLVSGASAYAGSNDRPSGLMRPSRIDADNVPTSWNHQSQHSLGAWDLGNASQAPALVYADYDGGGVDFHCTNSREAAPRGAVLIPNCVAGGLLPGQRPPGPPEGGAAALTTLTEATIEWDDGFNAVGYEIWRGTSGDVAMATRLARVGSDGSGYMDGGLVEGTTYHYWVATCDVLMCAEPAGDALALVTARKADADSNGLIEIGSVRELDNIRHDLSGASYRQSSISTGVNDEGCPTDGCTGFELVADIDFDGDDDDATTWTVDADGDYVLDADDHHSLYFDVDAGGWVPLGSSSAAFSAVFDGGGHSISGLASLGDHGSVGMFGVLGDGAEIRELRLVDNLAGYTGNTANTPVGGLAGMMKGGSLVVSCSTAGDAIGSSGARLYLGGLVGHLGGGHIVASSASGSALGRDSGGGFIGGLVGLAEVGSITASYAVGRAEGGNAANSDIIGGLVGVLRDGGSVTTSYASVEIYATDTANDNVGGLVGAQEDATIGVSYASGLLDGGKGSDNIGRILGAGSASGVTSSWGFGTTVGMHSMRVHGSGDRPAGATNAQDLTTGVDSQTDVPAAWNQASSRSMGAWNFGTGTQTPALLYADYDGPSASGAGEFFHCANDEANAPDDAILIPNCATPTLIPGQRIPAAPVATLAATSATAVGLTWTALINADRYEVWRAGVDESLGDATEQTTMGTAHTAVSFEQDGLSSGSGYRYWLRACNDDGCGGYTESLAITPRTVDADANGLIEIASAAELDLVRNNLAGTGLVAVAGEVAVGVGCPSSMCRGYELTADIDFDGDDADGTTWVRNVDGSVTLDADDSHSVYFDVDEGGWEPIGDCGSDGVCGNTDDAPFAGVFEGNGNTISNLASVGEQGQIGLFGLIGEGAVVRNLVLEGGLAHGDRAGSAGADVGGLAGVQDGGDIIACHSTGVSSLGLHGGNVGGLLGRQLDGAITASRASGDILVISGEEDDGSLTSAVGGLVGHQGASGAITASFANGLVSGLEASVSIIHTGGLVGASAGSITASYATGFVLGKDGGGDVLGGLVGVLSDSGSVVASYSTGEVDSRVGGSGDRIGSLIGRLTGSAAATDSYGFGAIRGSTNVGYSGSGDLPSGVTKAEGLTSGAADADNTNAPASWNQASSNTAAAWDFGTTMQAPALNYADYDGATVAEPLSGNRFHCDGVMNPPSGAALLPDCASAATLIPGQRQDLRPVVSATFAYAKAGQGQAPTLTITWTAISSADGYRVFRGAGTNPRQATEITDGSAAPQSALSFADTGFADGKVNHYWVQSCSGQVCSSFAVPIGVYALLVDSDEDGLIELASVEELNLMRHNLAGTSLSLEGGGLTSSFGCPENTCGGYELTADIDFDGPDADSTTWTVNGSGGYVLDSDDSQAGHFDTEEGGWVSIGQGTGSSSFNTVFEGNGYTITNLASVSSDFAGLFGTLGTKAEVRNLGLVDNLAVRTTAGTAGGIAAVNNGKIVASYTTGPARSTGNGTNRIGGLVGSHLGGFIQSCFATGDVSSTAGAQTSVGGLVSDIQSGASITASYATGDVTGSSAGAEGLGGLIGWMPAGTVTASWASGDVDAVSGDGDYAGKLIGAMTGGTATASWGFGATSNNDQTSAVDDSGDVPAGASSARDLTFGDGTTNTDVPASWNQASSSTAGAWRLGTSGNLPALNYADYDGATMKNAEDMVTAGGNFHCATADNPPDDALLIAGDCAMTGAIPGQLMRDPPSGLTATITANDAITLVWEAQTGASVYEVWRGESEEISDATKATADDFSLLTIVDDELSLGVTYHYWVVGCPSGGCRPLGDSLPHVTVNLRRADSDGNGLIEIYTVLELHKVRYDLAGTSLRQNADDTTGNTFGCPSVGGCTGYELANDLSFDGNGNGWTWRRKANGSIEFDTGDHHPVYFDLSSTGWAPIGGHVKAFIASFDGAGHTIDGLAIFDEGGSTGLFAVIDDGADIRNLGLVNNISINTKTTSPRYGGLVGSMEGGSITACFTTGEVAQIGNGSSNVGGLVGQMEGGSIIASFVSGPVFAGGAGGLAGGLVGYLDSGSITASYASGDVIGRGGMDTLGGLVGRSETGTSITASYATGDVEGGGGNDDVGGLIGASTSTITASYAAGDVDGGTGDDDVGSLVGDDDDDGTVAHSWGFGAKAGGETEGSDGSSSRPAVASASGLTFGSSPAAMTDAPSQWGAAASGTNMAWRFPLGSHGPVLAFADYDGNGTGFHCEGEASAPSNAVIVPNCGEALAGQLQTAIAGVAAVRGSTTTATLSWRPIGLADYYRVLRERGSSGPAQAEELTTGANLTDSDFDVSGLSSLARDFWVLGCRGIGGAGTDDDECSPLGQAYTLAERDADIDGDGLIDIGNAAELAIIANDLAGASYKATSSGAGFDDGCPVGGCTGYELVDDIDFDIDGDGVTWRRDASDNLYLDRGDHQPAYFDASSGGWAPLGDSTTAFTATFEGDDHTIHGLATLDDAGPIGMFGEAGSTALIRRLILADNLAAYTGNTEIDIGGLVGTLDGGVVVSSFVTGDAVGSASAVANIGGLVGHNDAGAIIASLATGSVVGDKSGSNEGSVGGLVGHSSNGRIITSFASGPASSGAGNTGYVGGLVGEQSAGSIIASYATGDAAGGAGTGDLVGGLVGRLNAGSIIASYATGDAAAGGDTSDGVGSLVGARESTPTVTASWGFGDETGATAVAANAGSDDLPDGVTTDIADLTFGSTPPADTDAPAVWNAAASASLGAWDFGDDTQTPLLRYADYDGSGAVYHCETAASPPDGAILIPRCGAFLPAQRLVVAPMVVVPTVLSNNNVSLEWTAVPGAAFYRVFRSQGTGQAPVQVSVDDEQVGTSFLDPDALSMPSPFSYTVQSCDILGCSASSTVAEVSGNPTLIPVGFPGQTTPLFRYEIGRDYPPERQITFLNRGTAIVGCTAWRRNLPDGMKIDTNTCTISGAPTRTGAQVTEHTVAASGAVDDHSLVIEIETHDVNPPRLSSPASGAISVADEQTAGFPIVLPNAGGSPTVCQTVSSGSFLSEISDIGLKVGVNGRNCEISLSDAETGFDGPSMRDLSILVEAVNAAGSSTAAVEISIGEGANPSAIEVVGGSTDFTFAANSVITPITFTRTGIGLCAVTGADGASLPEGLAVNQATCEISGTPTEAAAKATYTATLLRGTASASDEITIAVTDAASALEASASADLFLGRSDRLPVILAATAGVPTSCTAASSGTQAPLADHNLFIYATGAGCAIDSVDGQGPAPSSDGGAYTLSYEISASNEAGSTTSASALTLAVRPRPPITAGLGDRHTCATNTASRLFCWGANSRGTLGTGHASTIDVFHFGSVGEGTEWASVFGGSLHNCATTTSGELYCWGDGQSGRHGLGNINNTPAPGRVGTRTDWASIEAGGSHTCATTTSGELHCWGAATNGRLGLGDSVTSHVTAPQRVGTRTDWASVSGGLVTPAPPPHRASSTAGAWPPMAASALGTA